MGQSAKDVFNTGDENLSGLAMKKVGLGDLLSMGGSTGRLIRETVEVASNAATPSLAIKRLLFAEVLTGTTGTGEKTPALNAGSSIRTVRETLDVATAAATPTFPVLALQYVKTIATGAPAVKVPGILGATPGAGAAAPNSAGTSIVFHAETTGTGTADVIYQTPGGVAVPNSDGTSVAFYAGEVTGTATVDLWYLTDETPDGKIALTADLGGTVLCLVRLH